MTKEFVMTPAIKWLEEKGLSGDSVEVVRPIIQLLDDNLRCSCELNEQGTTIYECTWIYGRDSASSRDYESQIANALEEAVV